MVIYSVIQKRVFTPLRDLPTRIIEAIDHSSNSTMAFAFTKNPRIFCKCKCHCWVWRMVDSLYYSSRKISERCENSFVNYRIYYQKLCYSLRRIWTKPLYEQILYYGVAILQRYTSKCVHSSRQKLKFEKRLSKKLARGFFCFTFARNAHVLCALLIYLCHLTHVYFTVSFLLLPHIGPILCNIRSNCAVLTLCILYNFCSFRTSSTCIHWCFYNCAVCILWIVLEIFIWLIMLMSISQLFRFFDLAFLL